MLREPSPARKPGISSTGWPRPSVTPSPRQTRLRTSFAASSPMRDSRQRGGWEKLGFTFKINLTFALLSP